MAARSTALLPPMLGASGPRTYLLLFQNPAELRATGGMPGAYVVIRADRGKIDITDQGTAAGDLGAFDKPVLELAESDQLLYGERLGIYPADVNLTPDFPTAGALVREMYRRRTGRLVDGVLATDPIALSYLLAMLGTVPVRGGTDLTAANAVSVLLSKAYARDISNKSRTSTSARPPRPSSRPWWNARWTRRSCWPCWRGRPVSAASWSGARTRPRTSCWPARCWRACCRPATAPSPRWGCSSTTAAAPNWATT